MTRRYPISVDSLPAGRWVPQRGILVWVAAAVPPVKVRTIKAPPTPSPPRHEAPPVDLAEIADAIGVHPDALTCRDRRREPAATRAVAAWVLRAQGRSYPEVGRILERDHTTVIHAVNRVDADPALLKVARNAHAALVGGRLRESA